MIVKIKNLIEKVIVLLAIDTLGFAGVNLDPEEICGTKEETR